MMNQVRPDVDSIFCSAMELATPEARAAFVDEATAGDTELKSRVEQLLKAHFRAGDFLESPARDLAATQITPSSAEGPGTMIGPYKLREVIGEGGMGTVYVAEQEHPIRRKVALKVIKPGMDSREIVARFEAERQALALMDHPNIAKVYEAGTTELGRPYFVMELVRGLSITEYCDRASVSLRDRLELFVKVCQAVEHAHRKGVIHRDLKPSNVMVTLHDGVPVPKVIDFGVAKAINQRLTEHTLYTRLAQMVGTPMYMSPEQAELSGLDVDTRSDVYSLGVLLYELLTGATPFDKETFAKVGLDEMRRIIREDEPARPSQRISTLAAEKISTVSKNRGLDPRKLGPLLRGDLDWIVMKALEKDRQRRYESASALAADVQRYLEDRPVEARSPSMRYRLRKFVHRQRRTLSTAALLTLCGPLTVYAVFMLIRGPDAAQQSQTAALAASELPLARAPGRELPGLVPEPLLIPELGRWQLITKQPRGVLRSAVWSPDEKLIALGEANHVRIYDPTNLQLLHVLVAHRQPVTSVDWHPDGQRLASASEDGTVRLWTSQGVPTHLLSGHSGPVYKVAWRPDGEQLASASADGTVRLWNADGAPIRVLDEGGRHVFGIDWSPDGKLLASAGGDIRPAGPDGHPGDNSVRVWDPESNTLVRKFDASIKYAGLCVAWRPDGQQLAAGYGDVYRSTQGATTPLGDAGIRTWNVDGTAGPQLVRDQTGELGTISCVAWHPRGQRLAFGGRHGTLHIWNPDDSNPSSTLTGHGLDLNSISWKQDGSQLLTTSRAAVQEWDGDKSAPVLVPGLLGIERGFQLVKWSPDGSMVSARNFFWNVDGKPAAQPDQPAGAVSGWWEDENQSRRPDGTVGQQLEGRFPAMRQWAWNKNGWLAGASWVDASVHIWNDQGKLVATLKGHRGGVESVDWSPDGEWLASGGGDSVRLWKSDGTPGPIITGHTDEVYPVAWSPDGKWLASAGTDSTVRLWKPDGTPGPVFHGHQGGIHNIAWSPDSKRIASASWLDSTLRVSNVETRKTEWQALLLEPTIAVTLSATGQPLHGDRELVESAMLYLLERSDGTTEIVPFGDFRKRFAKAFVAAYAERSKKAAAKADWNQAETAFADAVTFVSDGDSSQRNQIARVGRELTSSLWSNLRAAHAAPQDYARGKHIIGTAVEIQEAVVAESPENREFSNQLLHIFIARGSIKSGMDQVDDAIAEYTKAIEWDPNNTLVSRSAAYHNRGLTWEELGQHDKALADYTKAIELNPKNSMRYINRAGLREALKQYGESAADYTKMIELNPKDWWAYHNRARMWELLQQHDKALSDYTKAFELNSKHSSVPSRLAWFLATCPEARFRDYGRAVELARNAVSIDPTNRDLRSTLSAAEYRNGNWTAALDASRKALDLRNGEGRVDRAWAIDSIFLAMTHWQLGNKDEAGTCYDKAVEWMEQNKSQDKELLRFRAEAAALLGVPEALTQRPTEDAQPAALPGARPYAVPLPEE